MARVNGAHAQICHGTAFGREEGFLRLELVRWSAWGAGIALPDEWRAMLQGKAGEPFDSGQDTEARPALDFVAPLQRRRLSRLSRMAIDVAHRCLAEEGPRPALIFCTQYGEYGRTFELLSSLAAGEPLSPAAFGASVHNSAAGLCSIIEGVKGHAIAMSAGAETIENAFIECWSLLAGSEADEALLLFHDEPLPAAYGNAAPPVPGGMALGLLLKLPHSSVDGMPCLALRRPEREADSDDAGTAIGHALAIVGLLTGARTDIALSGWTWSWNGDGPN